MENTDNIYFVNRFFTRNYESLKRRKNFLSNRLDHSGKMLSFDVTEKKALTYALNILESLKTTLEDENTSIEVKKTILKIIDADNGSEENYENIRKRLEAKNNAQ